MRRVFSLVFIFAIFIETEIMGQNNQYIELARVSIEIFKCSVTELNYKYYGLSSAKTLEIVQPGEAVIHYAVKLIDLQRYSEEKDPNTIIQEMGYVTVALLNPQTKNVESFVMLNKRDEKFEATGIGQDPMTMSFLEMKRRMELIQKARLVRIPGLNLAFAGIDIDGRLHLIPVMGRDQKETEPRPASTVFMELSRQLGKGEDMPR
jgi:hypothetical protein